MMMMMSRLMVRSWMMNHVQKVTRLEKFLINIGTPCRYIISVGYAWRVGVAAPYFLHGNVHGILHYYIYVYI